MTVTTHRDASFYVVVDTWSLIEAEALKARSIKAQAPSSEARDYVLLLLFLLLLFLLLHLALFPLRTLLRVSIALSFLPPTRAPFSNDRQRGLPRHRGNLLALRRIRADCLPLGVSKRAQTFPLPRPGTRRGEIKI